MNFKKKVVVFTILICICFSISCVAASDVNDTDIATYEDQAIGDTDDEVIASSQDDLISSSGKGTFTELQNIIKSASSGSTITLEKDYVYDSEFNSTKGIEIKRDITINGNGHTIDGLSKSRIFFILYGEIINHKVVLKDITFKNGYTKLYGGAIFSFADLTVDKCVFKDNYAGTTAGAICSVGSLNCKNSNFEKNTANGDAGAIFTLNVKNNLQFFNNYYKNIKDINVDQLIYSMMALSSDFVPSTDYITKCKFTKNVALGRGGGAVYAYTHVKIDSCTFTSNKADQMGGAVYAVKNLFIKNSKFTSNKVSKYGGAVYFKCHEITGSYDENGNWKSSIVFYTCSIKNSVFTTNSAKQRGGAIYGFKYADMPKKPGAIAEKCTFSDNKADAGNELYGGTLKNCIYKNTLTLKTVKIKKSASKLVLTATLKKGSKIYKNKKVTFTFNGVSYKSTTNSKGIAKVTVPSSVLKKLKVGKKIKYKASYSNFTDRKSAVVNK